jgi:hypothetical protein
VEQYAKEAALSIHTARAYVKQIYEKTGVRRQGELIRLLLQCHAPAKRHGPGLAADARHVTGTEFD